MMEGTRIHRKIQGSMGKEYQAEVPLSLVVEGDLYELTVEGSRWHLYGGWQVFCR